MKRKVPLRDNSVYGILNNEEGIPLSWFKTDIVEQANFVCGICFNVPSRANVTACGHVFCQTCIRRSLEDNKNCPSCRTPVEGTESGEFINRIVRIQEICCPFIDGRCDWNGTLSTLEEHISKCPCVPVECDSCSEHVLRMEMDNHTSVTCKKRKVTCVQCNDQVRHDELQKHQKLDCPSLPSMCSVCNDTYTLGTIRHHLDNECPKKVIHCPYDWVGCEHQSKREDMNVHLRDSLACHTELVSKKGTEVSVRNVQFNELQSHVSVIRSMVTEKEIARTLQTKLVLPMDTLSYFGYNLTSLIDGKPHAMIHLAARYGGGDNVKGLLDLGTDIDIQTRNKGYTPLMVASLFSNFETARVLLDRGASIDIISNEDSSAFTLAKCDSMRRLIDPSYNPDSDYLEWSD